VKGLAPGTAAPVEDAVARLGVEVGGNALGSAVVHLVPAVLEAFKVLQARTLGQHQGVGRHVAEFCSHSLGGEPLEHGLSGRLQGVGPKYDVGRSVERSGEHRPV
jgi:hypothetical protein